jgi:gamma-glutamyltranspeptidase / glutathione hydrolase
VTDEQRPRRRIVKLHQMRALPALLALFGVIAGSELQARQPVRARHAMVVTEEPLAADAGIAVLRSGGNAVDAAVAVALALAVTYPVAGNLGGGGFLLTRLADGRTSFIDFRERAPAKATRGMYLDDSGNVTEDSLVGWRASGVPGTVRGLELAHKKFGTKPWADLVKPAVELAEKGFTVPYGMAQTLRSEAKDLEKFPETKRIFLKNGALFEAGDRLLQPELARVLQRIQTRGAAGFYEGETAKIFASEMAKNRGLITLEDLKNYKAIERTPLTGAYRGYDIITAPPPSSGGIGLLQMLGVLEGSGYEKEGAGAASTIHFVAETMRRFYADRSEHFGDPDFAKVPVKGLLSPRYIEQLRKSIDPMRATPSDNVKPGNASAYESSETTHFSIVDPEGNAVSLTYTLNGGYGSAVTVPGLGFLLNNEMDDFAAKPGTANMFGLVQGENNAIQPGKTPLSSMTPTIVLREGKLFMVVGGPGGGRIISSVLQTFLNVVDFGMNAQDAVDAPRFHHQWRPDRLTMERGFSPDTIKLLEGRGHTVEGAPSVARIFAIVAADGWLQGAADGRSYGKAEGY